ncbi:MAG: putative deoxyribonuclease YcfH [Planctomycetota bacterium]|jgi:TatD DNase family protein
MERTTGSPLTGRAGTLLPVIDTHCHLTFPEYDGRVHSVLAEAREAGVFGAITISTTTSDAARALALAKAHAGLWSSAGVHPLYSDRPADWQAMREVGLDPKCVAWGELGLDRHYAEPVQEVQLRVLDEQLGCLARWRREDPRLAKPIVIHCREAFDELIPILRASGLPPERFVFHCFTAGPREMRLLLDFGAFVSFTGVVTFRNARETHEAARLVPRGRCMVETDAPFLTPEPHRTVRPNAPRFVVHVADALAALWGRDAADVRRELDETARAFFGLPAESDLIVQ